MIDRHIQQSTSNEILIKFFHIFSFFTKIYFLNSEIQYSIYMSSLNGMEPERNCGYFCEVKSPRKKMKKKMRNDDVFTPSENDIKI